MRKLASIREIRHIRPIEGADRICCAVVDGWECVVKKDEFQVGEKIIYIEIDSIVPDTPDFEFMRERKFRVRTIKLRKQVSQGLVVPLTLLKNPQKHKLGDDVTEILGIKQYDPEAEKEKQFNSQKKTTNPLVKYLMRYSWFRKLHSKFNRPQKSGFPAWITKTDEERVQNLVELLERESEEGTKFAVTEKLDGQSLTLFLARKGFGVWDFGVCSRNLRLRKPDNSSWWTIAKQIDAKRVLKSFKNAKRIVLQGEIIGTGIQSNKYGIKGYDFYAFNLIVDGKRFPHDEMERTLLGFGIKSVPLLETQLVLKKDVADMVEYAQGKSRLAEIEREGIVVRNIDKGISFKVISPKFLLAEKD